MSDTILILKRYIKYASNKWALWALFFTYFSAHFGRFPFIEGGGGQACDENRDYALFFFNCRDPYGKTHKKIIGFSVVEQLWSGHNQPPPLPLRP